MAHIGFAKIGPGRACRRASSRCLTDLCSVARGVDQGVSSWQIAGNHAVRKVAPNQTVTTIARTFAVSGSNDGIGAAASFNGPLGIAVDGSNNGSVAEYRK